MEMTVYGINLKRRTDKREHLLEECSKHNIKINIIDAVDGSQLLEEEIKQYVFDYPANGLTLGEIGCGLSHLKIYQKIIDTSCPLALILEDDILLNDDINGVLDSIMLHEKMEDAIKPNQPRIYLLSPSHLYWGRFKKKLYKEYSLNKISDAYFGYAYVINQCAAQSLKNFLQPLAYEIDRWGFFQQMGVAKIWCVVPPPVASIDDNKVASDLEGERKKVILKRSAYFRAQRKKMPFSLKLKKMFWKIIGIHFVKSVRVKFP